MIEKNGMAPFVTEKEMYPQVCEWLKRFLRDRYARSEIYVYDCSRRSLPKLIQETGLISNLAPEWPSWDIQVDIVGFIIDTHATRLAFVECKNVPIKLSHLSQILGYSRVVLPEYALILSPHGVSTSLKSLLITYRRTDVLQYVGSPGRLAKSVVVARWDAQAKCPDPGTMISGDINFLGRL